MDSPKPMPRFDSDTRLASTNAMVWFLGFGAGGATGLAFAFVLLAIWIGSPMWMAIFAALIAVEHALIIVTFWMNRHVVRRRTAVMVSMIASSILTCLLALMVGSSGMPTSPLYGLALMHLITAFCHPLHFSNRYLHL